MDAKEFIDKRDEQLCKIWSDTKEGLAKGMQEYAEHYHAQQTLPSEEES